MASFVLNPPPRVRVVSFFVTARFAGQSDRAAFLEAVLGQLSELLGQSLPDVLTEANQQLWFLELLEQAAEKCTRDGYRLVLVVDGLDEDLGVLVGGNVHSIAALLPGNPSPGVRIIVASRPSPPVPIDVPAWHPLNNPAIVRPLSQSAHAVIMRGDTQRELARLLDSGGLGRELLGLVVTAGGGLSDEDLAELVDEPVGEIERILHTVTGRTFTSRGPQWGISSQRVFVLAHEELQQASLRSLRSTELTRWQETIHAWAESYRDRGWPAGTPQYLLRGYLRMLLRLGDLPRMVTLATDLARLDRMLDISGGDAAALTDITAIQEYVRDQPRPDLIATLRLAYTRRDLIKRNSNIPIHLPAVWVSIGNFNRAEALTESITDLGDLALTMGSMSMALSEKGRANDAASFLDDAEAAARSVMDPLGQGWVLASLCTVVIGTGNLERAVNIVRAISEPGWKDVALASLAGAFAKAGDVDRAKSIAISSSDTMEQASALASVTRTLAEAGDLSQARLLADDAETIARSATEMWQQAPALASAALAAAAVGDLGRARLLADDAEIIAHSIIDRSNRDWVFASLARKAAEGGDLSRAEIIVRSITDQFQLAATLRSWSATATELGDLDRAEAIARSIADPSQQAPALESLSETVAKSGDLDRAETIACSISQPAQQASALASVAQAAAESGDLDRAGLLAEKAETTARFAAIEKPQQVWELAAAARALTAAGDLGRARMLAKKAEITARSIADPWQQAPALTSVTRIVALTGNLDRAETIARSITDPREQAAALASVAQAAAGSGDFDRASSLVGDIESNISTVTDTMQGWLMGSLSRTMAKIGNLDIAENMIRSIANPEEKASALASVAQAAAESGDFDRARLLVGDIEGITRSVDPDSLDRVLEDLSRALASIGEMERAETAARSISHPYIQADALVALTELVAKRGDFSKAETIARSIEEPDGQDRAFTSFAWMIALAGDLDRARNILATTLITTDPITALPSLAAIDASAAVITVQHFSDS
jgi:tetratricopeptide (TPR) repeat protein